MTQTETDQLDLRTAEILDRIKGVFASKGFDGASMQDLARAAGMSAGNFYRYFPSKDAIIGAMVQRDLDRIAEEFARVISAPSPRAALVEVIRNRLETTGEEEGALWAEIEAAATRRPEIAGMHERMEAEILRYLGRVFALIAGMSEDVAGRRFAAQSQLILLMVKGTAVQSCGAGGCAAMRPSADLHGLVLRIVDQLLREAAMPVSDGEDNREGKA